MRPTCQKTVNKRDRGVQRFYVGYCGEPAAFLVKHHETSVHWRCVFCFRDLLEQAPIVVLGYATPTNVVAHVEHRVSFEVPS